MNTINPSFYQNILRKLGIFLVFLIGIYLFHYGYITWKIHHAYQTYQYERALCPKIARILAKKEVLDYSIRFDKGTYLSIRDIKSCKNIPEIQYYLQHSDAFEVFVFEGGFIVTPTLKHFFEIQNLQPRSPYALQPYRDRETYRKCVV